jgi:hypothetical protein
MSGVTPWALGRDRVFLAAVAFAAAAVTLTGWALFGRTTPAAKAAANARYTHLHCPTCRAEFAYSTPLEGRPCPDCESEAGLVPTVGSTRDGTAGRAGGGRVLAAVVVGCAVVPGLGVLAVARLRAIRRAAHEVRNRPLLADCPFCQRRVSYPPHKVGGGHVCSRCKTAFVLPALDRPAG